MDFMHDVFFIKLKESVISVIPIILIVAILSLSIVPIASGLLLSFLIGSLLIVVGMSLFSLGADVSLSPIGSRIGTVLTKSRKLFLILALSFVLGIVVTMAEPDLAVLSETVPHINTRVLIMAVSLGVGLFLAIGMLRIIMGISLRWLLIAGYAAAFLLTVLVERNILSIAFDAGGVTTGAMTVPFILAMGVGVSRIRSDSNAEKDSFGLVALSSLGPILSVLILSLFYPSGSTAMEIVTRNAEDTVTLGRQYLYSFPNYLLEMFISLLPILVIFLLFQLVSFKMNGRSFLRILIGIGYTYIGLVLFMTGVNVGFSSLGTVLGMVLASTWMKVMLIPLAMILGWFIISAEPAVAVLEKQIEEVSAGRITSKAVKISLSVASALAMGFSMIRVITGISILYFLVPGYFAALLLSFFVPDIYTAIAFDSGGVASGPMTATFMLQFMIGASHALSGNVLEDAFGVVALVAMMPLITVQIMGVVSEHAKSKEAPEMLLGEEDIIELWEVPQ